MIPADYFCFPALLRPLYFGRLFLTPTGLRNGQGRRGYSLQSVPPGAGHVNVGVQGEPGGEVPSIPETVLISTPFYKARVAKVCRRSWKRPLGCLSV